MKAINQNYYDIDDQTSAPYVDWDLADDDDNIVVPMLRTNGKSGDTVEVLDSLINKVVEGYI